MKLYFEDLQLRDYFLFIGYSLFFFYLLARIYQRYMPEDIRGLRAALLSFFFYCAILLLDSFFSFLPFLPDTTLYTSILQDNFFPADHVLGVRIFYYTLQPLRLLLWNSAFLYILFGLFLYQLALIFYWKAWTLLNGNKSSRESISGFILLAMLWPAAALYLSVPLRDTFIIICFSFFLFSAAHFIKGKNKYLLIPGTICLVLFRTQFLFFLAPAIVLIMLYGLKAKFFLKLFLVFLGIFVLYVLLKSFLYQDISPEFLSHLRNLSVNKESYSGFTYGEAHWDSYLDVLKIIPALCLQFLVSPLPILIETDLTQTLIISADSLFVLVLLVLLLTRIVPIWKASSFWLLLMLLYLLMFGFYEFHYVGAVRHRMPLIILLLLPTHSTLSYYLEKVKYALS